MTDFNFDTPLSENEQETLEEFLIEQQEFTPFTTLSALDGFLTAVVSGPEMIPPNEWLAVIFGGDMETPKWTSDEQPQDIIALLLRLLNSIATVLSETPDYFSPLFLAYRDESDNGDVMGEEVVIVEEWCHGYMQGFMLRGNAWEGHDDAIEEFIHPIFIFGTEDGEPVIKELTDKEQKEMKASIPYLALSIYNYWLEIRSEELNEEDFEDLADDQETFFRPTSTVGPNDPCSCGSGKKYKKCCGLN